MYFTHSFILQAGWYGVQGSYADVTEAGLKIKLPTPHNHDAVPSTDLLTQNGVSWRKR